MQQKYIIIRKATPSSKFSGAAPRAGSRIIRKGPSKEVPPRPQKSIEIETLHPEHVAAVAAHKDVEAIAPAMPVRLVRPVATAKPSPADTGKATWGIQATGADTSPFTGEGIVVAVLDTGINKAHPAFKGVKLDTKDFTGEGIEDTVGHGTHCAGTIFGRNVKGTRIGVAPGIQQALIGKILSENGGGSDTIAQAVNWAVDNGAHIISMSLGIDFPGYVQELINQGFPADLAGSKALEGYRANVLMFQALATFVGTLGGFRQPTLLTAAAGNESQRDKDPGYVISVSPPAVAEGFLSVAALGQSPKGWRVADFSNIGALVAGPGVDIVSADLKDGLTSMSGTSMATPHVAGIAALWAQKLQQGKSFTSKNLLAKLIASGSTEQMAPSFDPTDIGSGMVQAPQR